MEQIKGIRLTLYNLSSTGWALLDSILMTFYVVFLLPPIEKVEEGMIPYISDRRFLGVLTVLGLIMIFGRLVDAIADPLIASWSDRSRSRFGRRRAFLMAGGVPLALSAVLIFFPPVGQASWINGLYLAAIFGLYFFSFTVYVGPYLALIPELGHTEKKRIGITTAQAYFQLAGNGIVMIGGPLLLAAFMAGGAPVVAYRWMAVILAAVGLVLVYLAVFAVDEKRFSNAEPSSMPLMESVKLTVRNRPFMLYLVGFMCLWFMFHIVRSSMLHITLTLVGADEARSSLLFVLVFAVAAICFPVAGILSRRIGKKRVMMLGLASFAVLGVLTALIGVIPGNVSIYAFIVIGLMGFPVAIMMVVPYVILSQLCDLDRRATGQRREGMFFGVQGFFMKLNLGVATAVLSFLYSAFGKDIASPLGVRLTPVAGSIVALVGLLVMSRFPEKDVQRQLDSGK